MLAHDTIIDQPDDEWKPRIIDIKVQDVEEIAEVNLKSRQELIDEQVWSVGLPKKEVKLQRKFDPLRPSGPRWVDMIRLGRDKEKKMRMKNKA